MTEPTVANGIKPPSKGDRIAKLLARAGIASRREIERMIDEGRVALDGAVLTTPATILTSLRGVTVDGHPVAAPEAARLFVYHKPNGLLVTERDPGGRPTIYDRLPRDLPRTMPVGRLDLNTEGLLLLTTDGGLKRQLELPATGVERTYRARAYGEVSQAQLEDLIEGIEIEGVRYGSIDANLERRTGANVWIELTLTEGKNREVRHVLEHLGLQVGRLIRTRYGPFILGDLAVGAIGEVKQHDLVAFAKTLGGTRRAKGADLGALVEVEVRKAKAAPTPDPAPTRVAERPIPTAAKSPARATPAAKPGAGWGSRTRPSRPSEPTELRPARPSFRTADNQPRAAGKSKRSARGGESPRTAPRAPNGEQRTGRTASDPRSARAARDAEDRPRAAGLRQDRPRAAPSGPAAPGSSAKPGKGPAGGRGRPARPTDRPRKGPPRGGPRGAR
ncbi:pseudouridine synthase [Sphingomonas rubra]|nr:pseudouridine synthase [Sphingomonas rubra]